MAEKLTCECGDASMHHTYVDKNNETVDECAKCKMFIKHPSPNAPSAIDKKKEQDVSNTKGLKGLLNKILR